MLVSSMTSCLPPARACSVTESQHEARFESRGGRTRDRKVRGDDILDSLVAEILGEYVLRVLTIRGVSLAVVVGVMHDVDVLERRVESGEVAIGLDECTG